MPCVLEVTKAIESIQGTSQVKVDLNSGKATFHKTVEVDINDIVRAIVEVGYQTDSIKRS